MSIVQHKTKKPWILESLKSHFCKWKWKFVAGTVYFLLEPIKSTMSCQLSLIFWIPDKTANFHVCLPHLFSFPVVSIMHNVKQRQQLAEYHLQLQTSHIDSHISPACLFREHLCAETAQRGYGLIFRCSRQLTLCIFSQGLGCKVAPSITSSKKTTHIKLGMCLNLEVEQRDKTAWETKSFWR